MICSVCRNHNYILVSFMTYHRVCNKSNYTTCGTSGAGTAYLSVPSAGADPGFQVRGAHLKKLRRPEGGANIFEVFRVKKKVDRE